MSVLTYTRFFCFKEEERMITKQKGTYDIYGNDAKYYNYIMHIKYSF